MLLTVASIAVGLRLAHLALRALRLDLWDALLWLGLAEHPAPPVARRSAPGSMR